MTAQAVTISSAADASGAFTVSGVFWLTPPANNVVPKPFFRSAVPNIAPADLAALRAGVVVEQPFTAPTGFGASGSQTYPAATAQAAVDTDIDAMRVAAQAALLNPPLATLINRAETAGVWAPYAGLIAAALPTGPTPQVVTDLYLASAQGLMPNITSGLNFGYVPAAAAAGTRILATTYAPAAPGVGAQRSMSSSSAADAAAGTGARTVLITYLTAAFVVKTETVTLNGVTAVNTANTDIAYIESMVVVTTGSGHVNAGAITLFNAVAGGGGTLGQIAAGDSQTNWAHHYVPAGKTCLLTKATFGGTLAAGRGVVNRTGDPSQVNFPVLPFGGQYPHIAGDSKDIDFQRPLVVPGPDYIFLSEIPNSAVVGNVAFGTLHFLQL